MIHSVDTILGVGAAVGPVLLRFQPPAGADQSGWPFRGWSSRSCPFSSGTTCRAAAWRLPWSPWLIRGIGIPLCIYLAIKKVAIRREVEPIIGFHASLLAGLGLIVAATFASSQIQPAGQTSGQRPAAAHGHHLAGGRHVLLIARRNAIAMVLGYIMMENGIYLVGTSFSVRAHHIVEFGILLDVLAGVMIMAIILQNIKQAFDDVDTALLRTLKE
jgi:hydrogenase-4 component E